MSAIETKQQLDQIIRRVKWHLLPMIILMYSLSMLDRSNIGFVKHYIEVDAGISDSAYALGAGIFFIGYALFEIPSNLMLHRLGARFWLSRIMVSWGIICIAMMFVRDSTSFYILRFLLGAAEAGFAPGVILFLTYWFPSAYRGQAYGWYYLGVPLALMFGGPFSGWLLETEFNFGLKNWQSMFLVQGLITVIVGVLGYFILVSHPENAKWLNTTEKKLLNQALHQDQQQAVVVSEKLMTVLYDWRVWRFVLIYFSIQISVYGVLFYLPTKLSSILGQPVGLEVGLYSAIPWFVVLVFLPLLTRISDRRSNWHYMAIALLLCAVVGIVFSTMTTHVLSFIFSISLAAVGFIVVQPIFWNLPTQYLSGKATAIGAALIGALGNLGGFVAPNLKNWMDQIWQNDIAGLLLLASIAFIGVLCLFWARPTKSHC
ncbi:MFS transporter [Acinetobacter rudis]|uniref:MFS transporter n=1 Tax=Acinetobacter rudis TaxID=632955 RepID=UPI00280FB955|nr:MFS transporter [Acinetobacter rudis]MDQ8953244.1 MFS transporter [Acinetobacter rudis]